MITTTAYASDVVHDRIGMQTGYHGHQLDRTGQFAVFTPLCTAGTPATDVGAIHVATRVRLTSRRLDGPDPVRRTFTVVTVDDPRRARALTTWMLWRVETWSHHGDDPADASWSWGCTYRLAVEAATLRPRWVELEGWSEPVHGRTRWKRSLRWWTRQARSCGKSRANVAPPA